MSFANSSLKRR